MYYTFIQLATHQYHHKFVSSALCYDGVFQLHYNHMRPLPHMWYMSIPSMKNTSAQQLVKSAFCYY